jgi:hypothetical protein
VIDLHAIGSVMEVLTGTPPARPEGVSMQGFLAGFEAGSPHGVDSIGEFVGFHGIAYARSTREGAGYGALLYGDRVISNGAVFLREGVQSDATVEVDKPVALSALYEDFEQRLGGPVCFVGTALFDTYHVTAIGRAPVHRENIFEHRQTYYPHPPRIEGNVPAAMMGCAAALSKLGKPLDTELELVLYENPAEPPAHITAHTHALQLRRPVRSLVDVAPALAVNVDHVLSDSIVRTGAFDLYRIRRIVRL